MLERAPLGFELSAAPQQAAPGDQQRRLRRTRKCNRAAVATAQSCALALLLAMFNARLPQVTGHSMEPQIQSGDHVLIDRLAYGLRIDGPAAEHKPLLAVSLGRIRRGDVVAFVHEQSGERRLYLKRVAGVSGDRLSIAGQKRRVPAQCIFVVGDNARESDDSRTFGPVPESAVVGRALLIVWPLNRARAVK